MHFAASEGGRLWDRDQCGSDTDDDDDDGGGGGGRISWDGMSETSLCLWVDAISISQNDNEEKGRQIRMMKEIFEKAQRVICSLGLQDEDFRLGHNLLRKMVKWYDDLEKRFGGTGMNQYVMGNVAGSGLIVYRDDGQLELEEWRALGRFFKKPYWRRIWIVQECTTTASTTYLCGTTAIASRTFEIAELVYLGCLLSRELKGVETITGLQQVMRRTAFRNFRSRSPHGEIRLIEVMHKLREFEASDARDKVYACMSVAADVSHLPIDYGLSVVEVYVNFVCLQISIDDNLDVLGFVGKSLSPPSGLPSWVPDWTTGTKRSTFQKVLTRLGSKTKDPVYHSDYFYRADNQSLDVSIKDRQLHLKGVFVDTIRMVGAIGGSSLFDVKAEYSWTSLFQHTMYSPTGESWLTAYFRVLVGDTCRKDGQTASRASQLEWPDDIGPEDALLETLQHTGTAGTRKHCHLKDVTRGRRCAVTQEGYIGLIPSYADVGDEIWVLVGGQVLYVLRDKGRWDVRSWARVHEFLGESYLHGFMDGEAGQLNRSVERVILE